MSIIIVTHGECADGFNPGLTQEGIRLTSFGLAKTISNHEIEWVFLGIGSRFQITLDLIIRPAEQKAKRIVHTPVVGTTASVQGTPLGMMVYLTDDRIVPVANYSYPAQAPGFDVWGWLSSLPDNSLVCTEPVFLVALGVKDAQSQLGQAYWVDPRAVDGKRIVQL